MEYFAGSVFTLITMIIVSRLVKKTESMTKRIRLSFSQSRQHELTKDYLPATSKEMSTQSSKHYGKQWAKVVISEGIAYWIEDSVVYSAQHDDLGIVPETKKVVDMMGIDKVELDKMIFIVERLTEGN